jgi:2-polyprenyl-3-methyl-5-hydroxy-6-metoxy-1,4-benzoquinol methylase
MPIFSFAKLAARNLQPEVMDQPGLDARHHDPALRALERINWLSGSAGILWPSIRTLARANPARIVRVLDIATGAGDVPLRLWCKAQRAGLAVQVAGCDVSPTALAHARRQAECLRADVRFFELDVFGDSIPGEHDVLVSSLFLHHLNEEQAVELLRRMGQAARCLVMVNDLVRSPAGFALAWLGTRLLTRSWVAHIDGPRSVEGAFTAREALTLAHRAGLEGATVGHRWPQRYLLTWRRRA